MHPSHETLRISRWKSDGLTSVEDCLAVEEPMEIRLVWGTPAKRQQRSLSITMRTPGNDEELALGFLFTEGVIRSKADVESVSPCGPPINGLRNVTKVVLHPETPIDWKRIERNFYTTSSCGVCGKTSLEALESVSAFHPEPIDPWPADLIQTLPERLEKHQETFSKTGGLHACGYFHRDGSVQWVREDVGRHNALDKLIGRALQEDRLPLREGILLLSGRASFELLQKSVMAGIRAIAAVGAPSSLAVSLAKKYDCLLIGFLREERFNVYHGEKYLRGS